jgi:putative ABC transport system substrate-binding protein
MRRREFIGLVGAAPLAVVGRAYGRGARRVGFLHPGNAAAVAMRAAAFKEGFSPPWSPEGGDEAEIVMRVADGDPDRLPGMAQELVRAGVEALLAVSPSAVRAAAAATRSVPIIAVDLESDPVANGWASSLARPGGNVTGVFLDLPEVSAKCLQLLSETVPSLRKVGIVWDVATGSVALRAVEIATAPLRIATEIFPVRRVADVSLAFEAARQSRVGGMMMLSSPIIGGNPKYLAELSVAQHLPTVTLFPEFAQMGGLLAYGPDLQGLFRQGAVLVRKALDGARPAELPIQRPERFQLVANLRTAKALGLEFPGTILVGADEVIE